MSTNVFPYSKPLTEQEAADRLGVSKATIERIRKRGEIRFTKVGSRIRYRAEYVDEYLALQETAPCRSASAKSDRTGLVSVTALQTGTRSGSTPSLDRRDALLTAQRTFGRPKSGT